MVVKVGLSELEKALCGRVEIVLFSQFDWVECFLEDLQYRFRLWVGKSWLLCRPICLKSSLALSIDCESSYFDLLGFRTLILNFMDLYIERVFLLHTLIWLVHLQVLYVVLILLIILLIFIIHSWITDIFKHVTFSSQIDLIRNSLNFCAMPTPKP